jgi:tellurite resistance protein TerC
MKRFRFLHTGLSAVLILIGAKMIAAYRFTVPTPVTLAAVALILLLSIIASVAFPTKSE